VKLFTVELNFAVTSLVHGVWVNLYNVHVLY